MRSIWSGSITFGLINIPVKLYPAVESRTQELDLDMLHKKDLARIRYARICTADGKEVPYKDIVKGYQYAKGEYVVLEEEDFQRANVKKTKTIEIQAFTYEREIDTVYFEKPYFLEPDKGAGRAYALLLDALNQSEKVAVVTFVLRHREYVGIIKPYGNALVLNQLRYFAEVHDEESLNLPASKSNAKELEMAVKLIDQQTEKFKPEAYKDTYLNELKKMIEEKTSGKRKTTKKGAPVTATATQDILSKLKASLKKPGPHYTRRAVPKTRLKKAVRR